MTEAIYGWMRDLAYTLLFFTAVLQLLPEGDYQRYVKYFLGLLLILTVLGPLLSVFSLDISIEEMMGRYLEGSRLEGEDAAEEGERMAERYAREAAALAVEEQLAEIFSEEGLKVAELKLEQGASGLPEEIWALAVPEGQGERVFLGLAGVEPETEGPRERRLKNQAAQVYGLEPEHIHITVRE